MVGSGCSQGGQRRPLGGRPLPRAGAEGRVGSGPAQSLRQRSELIVPLRACGTAQRSAYRSDLATLKKCSAASSGVPCRVGKAWVG